MKLIVAGSRDIEERYEVRMAIENGDLTFGPIDEVVHGGARGVDSLAGELADTAGWDVVVFEAEWDEHGKAAGPIRNAEMADYGDALVAVWDGESSGTRDMIEKALDRGMPVHVHVVS